LVIAALRVAALRVAALRVAALRVALPRVALLRVALLRVALLRVALFRVVLLGVVLLLITSAHAAAADPWTSTQRYEFEYRVDFSKLAVGAGEGLRIWVPYPADTPDQSVLSATIESPWPYTIARDRSGNRALHLEGQGVPPRDLLMRFLVERAPSRGIPAAAVRPGTPLDPERYRYASRLIPLDGLIRQVAEQQAENKSTEAAKIRAFYDYVVTNLRYNKDGSGWGQGNAVWACDNKRGNCTDFHSLFIGMARSHDIPARFIIGFPIPGDRDAGAIGGYHCWAEYFEAGRGWVPVDASEASKAGNADAYFGVLPSDRIEFTVGRDLLLAPAQNGPPLNYFIYPYAEVEGRPIAAREIGATFSFERLADDAMP
jgi:transglutaminase-like putative cysteine protease